MCLGGSSAPTWRPPPPKVIEAGPPSPDDMVNNQRVDNINDRSMQEDARASNRGATASGQKGYSGIPERGSTKSQSSANIGRAY